MRRSSGGFLCNVRIWEKWFWLLKGLLGWILEYLEETGHKCHGSGQPTSQQEQQPSQLQAWEQQFL